MIVRLLLFATAREAAGCSSDSYDLPSGSTLAAALDAAVARYGTAFAEVLATAGVWVNGDEPPTGPAHVLAEGDEIAVLPPVSGCAGVADPHRTVRPVGDGLAPGLVPSEGSCAFGPNFLSCDAPSLRPLSWRC